MLPPLCSWILANQHQCAQFALRGRRFCRAHENLARVEKTNLETRALIAAINISNLENLILCLLKTLDAVISHSISPNRAQLVFRVSFQRLENLQVETEIAELSNPDSPAYDPALAADLSAQLRSRTHNESYSPALPPPPSPAAPPLTMGQVFGPHMAGIPTPPGPT